MKLYCLYCYSQMDMILHLESLERDLGTLKHYYYYN